MTGPVQAGAVLNADEIRSRASEIFRAHTFADRCVRAAVYELRVQVREEINRLPLSLENTLVLEPGGIAALESYELVAMPWDLAGNLGVKYKFGIQGLFVSPGLFVDPGFGWVDTPGRAEPRGMRLTVMVTNVGEEQIPIRLGEKGDGVIGLQFLRIAQPQPKDRNPVGPRTVQSAPQGLSFSSRLTELREEVRELQVVHRETEASARQILQLGVFVILVTLFGALTSFIIATVLSGKAPANTVRAINDLHPSGPWGYILILSLAALAVTALAWGAWRFTSLMVGLFRGTQTHPPSKDASSASEEPPERDEDP